MDLHLIAVAAALDKTNEQMLCFRCGTQMDLRGQNAQNRPSPGVAPLLVGNHLALVNHRRFVAPFQVQLFCGSGYVGVLLPHVLLLAGGQGTGHPTVQKGLLGLQGQQAKGGKVNPCFSPPQPLKADIGFSRVGAPQVEDKVPVHRPGFWILVLGVQGDQQGQTGTDRLRDIPHRPHHAQSLAEQKLQGKALGPQQPLQIRFGLGGGKVRDRLPGGGEEYPGIVEPDLLRHWMIVVLPHPGPRPKKILQNNGQLLAAAVLLQSQEFAEPGRCLGRADHTALRHGGKLPDNGPVVVFCQPPGRGAVVPHSVPGPRQVGTGPPCARCRAV